MARKKMDAAAASRIAKARGIKVSHISLEYLVNSHPDTFMQDGFARRAALAAGKNEGNRSQTQSSRQQGFNNRELGRQENISSQTVERQSCGDKGELRVGTTAERDEVMLVVKEAKQ